MNLSHYLAHSNLLFSTLKILKLDDKLNSQFLKLMYILSSGNLPKQLDNFFMKSISVNLYNTRSEEKLHTPKLNTVKYSTGSLRYNAPLIWNNFSSNNRKQVVNISTSKFKALAKTVS